MNITAIFAGFNDLNSSRHTATSYSGTKPELSAAEKAIIQQIINRYDQNSFSQTDKETMFKEINDAGIPISRSVLAIISAGGFCLNSNGGAADTIMISATTEDTEDGETLFQQYCNGKIDEAELRAELMSQNPTYYRARNSYSHGNLISIVA